MKRAIDPFVYPQYAQEHQGIILHPLTEDSLGRVKVVSKDKVLPYSYNTITSLCFSSKKGVYWKHLIPRPTLREGDLVSLTVENDKVVSMCPHNEDYIKKRMLRYRACTRKGIKRNSRLDPPSTMTVAWEGNSWTSIPKRLRKPLGVHRQFYELRWEKFNLDSGIWELAVFDSEWKEFCPEAKLWLPSILSPKEALDD